MEKSQLKINPAQDAPLRQEVTKTGQNQWACSNRQPEVLLGRFDKLEGVYLEGIGRSLEHK